MSRNGMVSRFSRGSRLGRFRIESRLGQGGMGEVYLARDSRLGRVVAIKLLSDAVAADPESRERFEREARSIAALSHLAEVADTRPAWNPAGPAESWDPLEPGVAKKVHRGGSFLCTDQYCSRYRPDGRGKGALDTGTDHLGFRLARDR